MLNPINKTIELGDGRTITIETGKLAKQADGAVTVRMNNTVLLATVCAAKDANPGVDFMPLQVEYKEKYSAFGRFPGGFTKREGKASDGKDRGTAGRHLSLSEKKSFEKEFPTKQ